MILCAGWDMSSSFNQAVYNSAFTSTSCLYRGSRSTRGESFGLPQSFFVYSHSSMYACGLLDSRKYVSAFQITYVQFIHQLFLSNLLVSPLFAPDVIHCLRQKQLKYLPGNAFSMHPSGGSFGTGGILSQMK